MAKRVISSATLVHSQPVWLVKTLTCLILKRGSNSSNKNLNMDCNMASILSAYLKTEPMDAHDVVCIKKEITEEPPLSKTPGVKTYRRYRCKMGQCKEVFLTLRVALEHRRTHLLQKAATTVKKKKPQQRRILTGRGHFPDDGPRKVFRCAFQGCFAEFKWGSQLRRHCRTHTGEKPYQCPYDNCNRIYTSSHKLKEHTRIHTGEKPHECKFDGCNKRFRTWKALTHHSISHTGDKRYACEYDGCGRRFAYMVSVKHHVEMVHISPMIQKCRVRKCGQTFTDKVDLENHALTHASTSTGPLYACTIESCNRRFRSLTRLGGHLKKHEGVASYKCTFLKCKKWFPDKVQMEEHVISHAGGREFECDVPGCGDRFLDTWLMEQHVLEHPEGSCRPFSCLFQGCRVRFNRFIALRHHGYWHKIREEGPFICTVQGCGKVFEGRRQLAPHIRTHAPRRENICPMDWCGRKFKWPALLERHAKEHGGDKEFKCNVAGCGVSSTDRLFIEKHVLDHGYGLCYPFICPKVGCPFRYRKLKKLQEHMEVCEPK